MHIPRRRSRSRMQTAEHTIWSKKRNRKLWFGTMLLHWTIDNWIANIRMLREVIMYICQGIVPFIHKIKTNYRNAIPVELSIAVTLNFLPAHAAYCKIANLYGLEKLTLVMLFHSACKAIVENLMRRFIYLMRKNEVSDIADLQEM